MTTPYGQLVKRLFFSLFLPFFALSGCAAFGPDLYPGEPEEKVIAKYGKPTARYFDGDNPLLEYSSFSRQQTFMVRLDPQHRFLSREQVLTVEKFDTIIVGEDDMQSVLLKVGQPVEKIYLRLKDYNVWSYRYKENGIWDSMMHIKFDQSGIVRNKENGLDPLFLPRG